MSPAETAVVGTLCALGGCFAGASGVASCSGIVKCIDRHLASMIVTFTPLVLNGVHVQVEEVALRPGRHFSVFIKELRVANPEGFTSPFLVVVNRCSVTVNLQALICSVIRGLGKPKDIHIQNTTVEGASLTYEKTLHTSNVAELLAMLTKEEAEQDEESAGVGLAEASVKGVADSSVVVKGAGTDLVNLGIKALQCDVVDVAKMPDLVDLRGSVKSAATMPNLSGVRGEDVSMVPKKPRRCSCFSGLGRSKEAKKTKYSPNVHIHEVDISKVEVVPLAPGSLSSSFALPVPVPPIYIKDMDVMIEGPKNIARVIKALMTQVASRTVAALSAFSDVGRNFSDGAGGVVGKVVDTKVHAEAVSDLWSAIKDIPCCSGKDASDTGVLVTT